MSELLTDHQIALTEAVAVIPTARHAIDELVNRLAKVDDQHALREAKVAQRALEWVSVRLESKLREG